MTDRIRQVCLGIVLLLSAAATPLAGQGFGTPEYYFKEGEEAFAARSYWQAAVSFRMAASLRPENADYQLRLATALAADERWDEAREAFARALSLNPDLRAQAEPWLARVPGAAPAAAPSTPAAGAPTAPAAPAKQAPPASGAFAVGAAVEIQYRAGEWFPGVVAHVDPGACPYYRVRSDPYGNGNPSELGYFCGSVRAPTGIAQPRAECGGSNPNCTPTEPPPLGTYLCSEQVWQGASQVPQFREKYHGPLTLLSGNRYRMFDDGAVGQFRYDPATHRIRWTGGGLASRGGVATYGLDGATPEITIVFETEHSRRTGNPAPRWQCALGR